MALGIKQEDRRVYLSISNGSVTQGTGDSKSYHTYVDGTLGGIYTKESQFGLRWHIELRDGGEIYDIVLPYSSGVFKSIVLALASDQHLSTSSVVRIEPYLGKNGFTKVVVYTDGVEQKWITDHIPEQTLIQVGSKRVKDDTRQMEFICSVVGEILSRMALNSNNK